MVPAIETISEGPPKSVTVWSTKDDDDEDVRVSTTGDPVRDNFKDILEQAFRLTESFDQAVHSKSRELRERSGSSASENGQLSDVGVGPRTDISKSNLGHVNPREGPTRLQDKRTEAERSFIKDRGQYFKEVARGNQNILHFLAKDGRLFRNRISLKWVALRIMAYYPELMGHVDDQNRTPLSLAITERNDLFIRAYGGVNTPYWENIREELKKECEISSAIPSETCLHFAMVSDISSQSRKIVIDRAPVEMVHMLSPAGLTPLHLAVDFNRCSPEQVDVVGRLLSHELAVEALTKKTHIPQYPVKNRLSVYQYHEYTRRMSHGNGERRLTSANKIREMLKLEYLRKLGPGPASRCLCLPGEPLVHFWFDLGPTAEVFEKQFERDFSHHQLNSTLQYVAFPHVSVISDGSGNKPSPDISGRTDMLFFFKWLRESKKVDHILNVIVDDLKQPSHSDEVVEKALENFGVEVLDWRKVDMCPRTIYRIGSNIHTLHLYWSGRNSVLRGWCEANGLARLGSLQRVHLHVDDILDSEDRTASNIDEFKKGLYYQMKNRKTGFSVDDDFKEWQFRRKYPSQTTMRETKQGLPDSHAWLECMDTFVKRFRTVTCPASISYKPIVVALLDDGVTLPHEGANPQLFDGTSFQTYESDQRVSPYWISETGHGTLMARLIHRICPKAMIKVFKLRTRPTMNLSKVQIVESSAIEAIDDAVSMKVDVISMSWTVNSNTRGAFKAAIERAAKAKILMFCAASDKGKGKDINYPHNCSPNDTFRVGAVKASGQIWEWVPEPEKLDIGLPGHDVLMKHDLPQGNEFKLESHTGSSVATALATGLAALILECVRLGHAYCVAYKVHDPDLNITENDYTFLRTREGMMKAFARIGMTEKLIEVVNVFDRGPDELKGNSSKLETAARIARKVLDKGAFSPSTGRSRGDT
ncbi:hypothetical protein BDW62DRAFT_114630 [Aspergillus aurantiobrunneus]